MKKLFAYLRCSGRGQIDGDTWDRQIEAVNRLAHSSYPHHGAVCVYREPGISGELQDRPALAQMLLDIEDAGPVIVIIEKLDRLARDLMTQENIIRDLQKRGAEIVSVAEPDLCSDDASRKLIRQIIGAIAEYDRVMIVYRTRVARERIRARTGRCEGRKPYGFHPLKPHEQDVLARIQVMASDGWNWTSIANELNRFSIPPRKGRRWYPATVGRILRRGA